MLHRLKLIAVLVLTLASAGQLILHNHSLIPEARSSALACSVCAFSADTSSSAAPSLAAPLVTAMLLDVAEVLACPAGTPLTLPSRAPPSALA